MFIDENLKTARIIQDTFSFCASLRISARIGITPYLKREQVRKNFGPIGLLLVKFGGKWNAEAGDPEAECQLVLDLEVHLQISD